MADEFPILAPTCLRVDTPKNARKEITQILFRDQPDSTLGAATDIRTVWSRTLVTKLISAVLRPHLLPGYAPKST